MTVWGLPASATGIGCGTGDNGCTFTVTVDGLLLSWPLLTTNRNLREAWEFTAGAVNFGFGEDEPERDTLGPAHLSPLVCHFIFIWIIAFAAIKGHNIAWIDSLRLACIGYWYWLWYWWQWLYIYGDCWWLAIILTIVNYKWNLREVWEYTAGAVNFGFGEDESERDTLGPAIWVHWYVILFLFGS